MESQLNDHHFVFLVFHVEISLGDSILHVIYSFKMHRHVSCEDTVDHQLAYTGEVLGLKFDSPVVLCVT